MCIPLSAIYQTHCHVNIHMTCIWFCQRDGSLSIHDYDWSHKTPYYVFKLKSSFELYSPNALTFGNFFAVFRRSVMTLMGFSAETPLSPRRNFTGSLRFHDMMESAGRTVSGPVYYIDSLCISKCSKKISSMQIIKNISVLQWPKYQICQCKKNTIPTAPVY